MGKPKSRVCNAFVPGPLEQYAPGFRAWLLARGYTPLTTVPQLQLMAHVSRWLEREGLTAAGLTGQQAGRFLAARHAAGSQRPRKPAGLRPLLGYLGGLGVLPPEPPGPPPDAASVLIAEFAEYLRSERGLAPMTVAAYSSRAARFVARYAPDGDPGAIMPGDVTRRSWRTRPACRPPPGSTWPARCARSCGTATCGAWSLRMCPLRPWA